MSVESVLSEILGVSCTEVRFIHKTGYFTHGTYLRFVTHHRIYEHHFGSITYISQSPSPCGYKCSAELIEGEETSRIIRAIADELVW